MSIDLTCSIPADSGKAWDYLAAPGAFVRISPPFMPLRPVSEADSLRDGVAVLEPRTALPGPLGARFGPRWSAQHDPAGYVEGAAFVDRCVSQPYAGLTGWVHEHSVTAGPDGTTLLGDRVRARVPGRLLAPVFAYRYRQMATDLDRIQRLTGPDGGRPLTVAVTGASGLVGTALCALLGVAGHRVIRLVRGTPTSSDERRSDERQWDPADPAADLLDGVDVLVHLAGASIAGRFTDQHLATVSGSRIGPTRRLAELVAARDGATAMVCASAVGYYGADRGDEILTEDSDAGSGPLAEIVAEWEADCEPARRSRARLVSVRTGIVLSGAGGMLPPLAAITRTGLGGRLGSGRQWMSWIALDDLTDIYLRAIVDPALTGVVNAVAPEPVRNSEFTRVLGAVLHRPTLVPVPGFAPGLILGRRGSDELALADQKVDPGALRRAGHQFRFPGLRAALDHELGAETLPAAL
ncbi:TIGR01777 family oxidoreductase [Rhodococcus sp. IEGM 1408]|uniref:TIGR01777 family oxidoreductase n=1 Tax=Rhodococcus sp. IEGM 1408 TaxID=3082220 RepID=UPI00295593B0|nr:TIGR01777 family oxidoreductase [Rhodococcus sp. IEGM 1408]MDV7999762.1 TIGR01777 family oxidoreductase [Rhodococcus sp. IEGM 1408]